MALNSGIYSQIQPQAAPYTIADAEKKQASLASLSLQNQAKEREIGEQDRSAHLQKASIFGNALEGISGLAPEQRAQAYAQVRGQLVNDGVMKAQDLPEQYDNQFVNASLARYRAMEPAIKNELTRAQTGELKARTAKDYAEAKKKGVGGKFMDAAKEAEAKEFVSQQKSGANAQATADMLDDALGSLVDYNKKSILGTGPVASLGGYSTLIDKNAENLDRKFKGIALEKMKAQFSGMSKAIDSDAERRFFLSAEPNLTNRPETNANIILAAKSLTMKQKAEADAQRNYVEQTGSMDGYRSPVLGQVTTVVDPSGQMQLIPNAQKQAAIKQGFKTLDSYAKGLFGKKSGGSPGGVASASADESAPAAPPPGMIRMMSPAGKPMLVREADKGEAIAAGGKVIK